MNKLYLLTLGFALAAGLYALNYCLSADLRAVQSGELELRCVINDGERVIDGGKVTGLMGDTWIFSNGHAKNCSVKPAK